MVAAVHAAAYVNVEVPTMMGERLMPALWLGCSFGLAGVAFVVWHKVDVKTVTLASLLAVAVSRAGMFLE